MKGVWLGINWLGIKTMAPLLRARGGGVIVNTASIAGLRGSRNLRLAGAIPLRRYGQPEEVAALVAFLGSADAGYITGGIYPVDGGSMA